MPTMKDMNSAGGCELLALRKAPAASDDAKKHQHAMADLEWRALKAEMARDRAYAEIAAKDQAIAERDKQIAELQENLKTLQALTKAALEAKETGKPATVHWDELPADKKGNGSVWECMGDMLAEKQAAHNAKLEAHIQASGLFRSNPIHVQLFGKVAPAQLDPVVDPGHIYVFTNKPGEVLRLAEPATKLHQFSDFDERCDQCGCSRQDVITSAEMYCNGQSAKKS